jgi:NAD-dependent SIR2 family protein deacetylase
LELKESYARAAEAILQATGLVITAGAGMGVDSGLPDFRGDQGFWKAYPPYERLGITFVAAANPDHFDRDPGFGWGFYGHRANLYRATVPHRGFAIILDWVRRFRLDNFVVTSNVDGQFQKAGFPEERILEVHGSIHHLQCTTPCSLSIWANRESVPVDESTMRARAIPACIRCGAVARPNILMFGDFSWISRRTQEQEACFDAFLEQHQSGPLVVLEMGAGTAIPTIRALGERLSQRSNVTFVRVNPREPWVDSPQISLPVGALEGVLGIDAALSLATIK